MPKRSYIKLIGPPLLEAMKELEKIAVDMPEVCIMDTIIDGHISDLLIDPERSVTVQNYFSPTIGDMKLERCNNIISRSGEMLGEYDFFFEWFTGPNNEQLHNLIEKMDETLTPLKVKYTITTKKKK